MTPVDVTLPGDGVVRVGLRSLIAFARDAESLPLSPRGGVRARQSGGYRSPFRGRGMEFDEARPYMPGDDVRSLDWRVTARTGRPHTKLFREERERPVLLCVDLRGHMAFATRGAFKAVRAAQAAALLGWSALHRGDRLGGLLFGSGRHTELRPKRGKGPLLTFLDRLAGAPIWERGAAPAADDAAGLAEALGRLRRVAQPGSLVVLFSDFRGLDGSGEAHLAQLARHNDVILTHVYDPLEAELPPAGRYRVSDGVRFRSFDSGSRAARRDYAERFTARREALSGLCRRSGMYLLPLATDQAPLTTLQTALGGRRGA